MNVATEKNREAGSSFGLDCLALVGVCRFTHMLLVVGGVSTDLLRGQRHPACGRLPQQHDQARHEHGAGPAGYAGEKAARS